MLASVVWTRMQGAGAAVAAGHYFFSACQFIRTRNSGRSSGARLGEVELLAVGRRGKKVYLSVENRVGLKQGVGHADFEGGARADIHGHQLAVRSQVVEFLAIATPLRLRSAARRELALLRKAGEGCYVHLQAAAFERVVGDPAAIGEGLIDARGHLLHLVPMP